MSDSKQISRKTAITIASAAAACVAGYVIYKSLKSTDKGPKASSFAGVPKKATQQPAQQGKKESTTSSHSAPSSTSTSAPTTSPRSDTAAPAVTAAQPQQQREEERTVAVDEGGIPLEWPELGVKFEDYGRWTVSVDPESKQCVLYSYPLAMMRLEHSNIPSESIVTITFMLEDISKDFLSAAEYKEKTKQLAMNTDLSMMLPKEMLPKLRTDSSEQIGPFTSVLEYDQMMPGPTGMRMLKFRNLMTVIGGFAYVMQFTADSDIYGRYVDDMHTLAKRMTLTELKLKPQSVRRFISAKHSASIDFPVHWVPSKPQGGSKVDGLTCVIEFNTFAESKPDRVAVYYSPDNTTDKALAEAVGGKFGAKPAPFHNDTAFLISKDATKKLYIKGNVVLQAIATKDRLQSVNDKIIKAILDSIHPHDAVSEDSLRVYSPGLRVSFACTHNSSVTEQKLGEPLLNYYFKEDTNTPSFAITVPTPENDRPAPQNAEEWYDRVEQEFGANESTKMISKNFEEVGGVRAVAVMSSEMVPTMMGGSEERYAKMLIIVRDGETVLLRFECIKGEWKKNQRQYFDGILSSLQWE